MAPSLNCLLGSPELGTAGKEQPARNSLSHGPVTFSVLKIQPGLNEVVRLQEASGVPVPNRHLHGTSGWAERGAIGSMWQRALPDHQLGR